MSCAICTEDGDESLHTHLSDDELIGLLYGLGDAERPSGRAAPSAASAGAKCSGRWGEPAWRSATEISGRRLAAQRQQILERLDALVRTPAWRWVPAAAAASLLAAGSCSYPADPARSTARAGCAASPSMPKPMRKLFTDVYSMEQDVEPRAAAPIRALFQEASFESAAQRSPKTNDNPAMDLLSCLILAVPGGCSAAPGIARRFLPVVG